MTVVDPSADMVDRIIGVLSPYIGSHMARATVEAHAVKLGLDPQHLTRTELAALADRILLGLRIFVGPAKADEAAHAIRLLGAELGAPLSGPERKGTR